MRIFVLVPVLVATTLAATPVLADCKSDLGALKARLEREPDKEVKAYVRKHVERAEKELKGSESECRNEVTRGWRAYAQATSAAEQKAKQAVAERNTPLNARERVRQP